MEGFFILYTLLTTYPFTLKLFCIVVTKESLVCTKEQSMILKAKGYTQKSLFAWTEKRDHYGTMNILDDNIGDGYAAFTTPELVDIMPKMGKVKNFLFILKTNLEPVKVANYLICLK